MLYSPYMKITLVCGSTAEKSHTRALLYYIEEVLHKKGVETVLWDLREKKMMFAMPEFHNDPRKTPDPTVQEFIKLIDSSDGVVLGSPFYHGSYSGVLKNSLDNLYADAFRNKAVGLVANGSGVRGAIKACAHLREVVRALYGYALQTEISTGGDDYTETSMGYTLTATDVQKRCEVLVTELINLTKVLVEHKPNKK